MAQSEVGDDMLETQMAENFEICFRRQMGHKMLAIAISNHKAVNGRTSGNDSHPLPAIIWPTRQSGRLRDRVDHLYT